MRQAHIIIVPTIHHNKSVVSLSFENEQNLISKAKPLPGETHKVKTHNCASRRLRVKISNTIGCIKSRKCFSDILENISSQTTGIHPDGNHYHFWKSIKNSVFSYGVNTYISRNDFAIFKNSFNGNFFNDS